MHFPLASFFVYYLQLQCLTRRGDTGVVRLKTRRLPLFMVRCCPHSRLSLPYLPPPWPPPPSSAPPQSRAPGTPWPGRSWTAGRRSRPWPARSAQSTCRIAVRCGSVTCQIRRWRSGRISEAHNSRAHPAEYNANTQATPPINTRAHLHDARWVLKVRPL